MKFREVAAPIIVLVLLCALPAVAQTYTPLYTYPGTDNNTSGIIWPSVLAQGEDGNLYSTIQTNGAYNNGSVYKITPAGGYTLLYSFCAEAGYCTVTGGIPDGGVTLGFDGNLWGTTQNGGTDAAGTVFKITPEGAFTSVYSFTNGTDDSAPIFTVLQGQDGNMYGVSGAQYSTQYGSFFKLTTKGKITAHPFVYATDGAAPSLPVQGTDGNFYGTTQGGGDPTCKCGLVYKATTGGKITVLHKFTGYVSSTQFDGSRPIGILVQGFDGALYGTTYTGGSNNQGTVFKITTSGTYTPLHSFVYASPSFDGELPIAGLTLGTDGNFYGVTANGGAHAGGAFFKITPAGTETVLYSLCTLTCYDGLYLTTPMILHTDGKFYGNTAGNSLGGAVFYSFDVGLKPFVKSTTTAGKVGATVALLGQDFTGASGVSFNGAAAKYTIVSDTYLTAKVPSGASTGSVNVVTASGTLVGINSFRVIPTITSFTPTGGIVGTTVTITGVSLKQATAVTIGGKSAAFTVASDTQVTATVPAGAKTGQKITVTTPGGVATSKVAFAVVPSITSFTPANGAPGISVTIKGNSFTKATAVSFGGVAATSYSVTGDTQVTAVVPSGAITGPIAITTLGGTGTSSGTFTVLP